ncbi:MAG: hypothetical protein WKF40_00225 [Thermoleophilaceae bacterium]
MPEAKSRASTSATLNPRLAASSALPVPVDPAPITTMSKVSPAIRWRSAARWARFSRSGMWISLDAPVK